MISLSNFLTNFISDKNGGCVYLPELLQQIQDGVNAYKKHLNDDVPKTVQWIMIEKQLIIALEHMESPEKSKKERESCDHKWVERLDGYEEQCGPAICNKCGLYGCCCDAKWGEMSDEERSIFERSGINGNDHEIEKRLKERS